MIQRALERPASGGCIYGNPKRGQNWFLREKRAIIPPPSHHYDQIHVPFIGMPREAQWSGSRRTPYSNTVFFSEVHFSVCLLTLTWFANFERRLCVLCKKYKSLCKKICQFFILSASFSSLASSSSYKKRENSVEICCCRFHRDFCSNLFAFGGIASLVLLGIGDVTHISAGW